jgi:hypothetical protein
VICLRVLSRRNPFNPSRRSTPNSCRLILLQTLCRSRNGQPLWNQANPNSFGKTPGVGMSQRLRAELRFRRPSSTNPFASYHIPVNPAVSGNYALFCATARRYPSCNQEVAHSFYRHGGGTPSGKSPLTPRLPAGGNTGCLSRGLAGGGVVAGGRRCVLRSRFPRY